MSVSKGRRIRTGRQRAQSDGFKPTVTFETSAQFGKAASVIKIPTHTSLFEASVNEMLTGRLNRTATDLKIEPAIASIVHASLVVGKIGDGAASGLG